MKRPGGGGHKAVDIGQHRRLLRDRGRQQLRRLRGGLAKIGGMGADRAAIGGQPVDR